MRAFTLAAFAAVVAFAAAPARAIDPTELLPLETISCDAVALDGDTLLCSLTAPAEVAGESLRVRLWGISAPEMRETEGWMARAALDELLADSHDEGAPPEAISAALSCRPVDRHEARLVAVCRAATGQDLAESVVWSGFATEHRVFTREGPHADPALADAYAAAERDARRRNRGLWKTLPHPRQMP